MLNILREIRIMDRNHPFFETIASSVPNLLFLDNGDTITSLYDIANTFNNYFASLAETTKKSKKYSYKHLSEYLSHAK